MRVNGMVFSGLMLEKNIKQEQLAEMIGTKQPNISSWIQRNSIPNKWIGKLKEIFGNDLEKCFFTEEDLMLEELNESIESQNSQIKELIPYYSVDVLAGNSESFEQILKSAPTDYYQLPSSSSDMVVDVYGDSMVDRIYSGDKIAISKLNDMSFFNFGAVHVIVTKEQRLLKYLKKHEDNSMLNLVSQNDFYDTIEIPKKSIVEIWIVDEILRKARN